MSVCLCLEFVCNEIITIILCEMCISLTLLLFNFLMSRRYSCFSLSKVVFVVTIVGNYKRGIVLLTCQLPYFVASRMLEKVLFYLF